MARKTRIIQQPQPTQNPDGSPLANLSESGTAPRTRLNSWEAAKQLADSMIQAGQRRNATDAQVYGMVTGRPPYSADTLRKHAQTWRTNANWGVGKSYLETAITQPWDVVTSAPAYCGVTLDIFDDQQREEWSKIVSEEFDRLNKRDRDLLYMFQLSQHNMILYRYGPAVWFHTTDFRAQCIPQEDLFVLENTKSNVGFWEAACVRVPYAVHQLYGEVRNAEAATKAGWKIETVKKAIHNAMTADKTKGNQDWMAIERKLANNDLTESAQAKAVLVYWLFWREFPTAEYPDGAISMAAVAGDGTTEGWLFNHVNRYKEWRNCICAFYYDMGDGTHHSVKGLGTKMFNALATYDRLQCHAVDAAIFGAAHHIRPLSDNGMESLAIQPFGPLMIHPPGTEYVQTTPMGQSLDSLIGVKQDLLFQLGNNLALYRQQRGAKKGNPPTAFEVQTDVENTSILGKSQMTRYFEQLDDFWGERYRRAANPNQSASLPGGEQALEFQRRCVVRGVPKEVLTKVDSVKATRTIGYGNASARNLVYRQLMEWLPLYNEAGRANLLEDVVNSLVGYTAMRRILPLEQYTPEQEDQMAEARQSVASMKVGVPPMLTKHQNPVIYANEYLKAGVQAAQSLEQGADPKAVYDFLTLACAAIKAHLDRIANDPSRQQVYQSLLAGWKRLTSIYETLERQIKGAMEQQLRKQRELQAKMDQNQQDMALKQQEMQGKMALKAQEKQHGMELKEAQSTQKMRLADATTAAKIENQRQLTEAKAEQQKEKKATDE